MRLMILVVIFFTTVMFAVAVDRGTSQTLNDARDLIDRRNWQAALPVLRQLASAAPDDADTLNLLAYTLRHTGDYPEAERIYLEALRLEPLHLGANEYLGELYVQTGEIEQAQERLSVIEGICGTGCEEYVELSAVISAAE